MSEAAEADPVVICVGSDHFRAHTGAAWRAVADGAIVRVSDRRSGEVLGWLMRRTPHELADRIWQLPDPHEAADDLDRGARARGGGRLMPTGTPNEPLDSNGRPLASAALRVHLMKQAELDAAAAAREDIEALARVVCRMAARGLMMPAPDALAVLGAQGGPGGREDALRCLRAAGYPPEPQAQRWAEERPLRQQPPDAGTAARTRPPGVRRPFSERERHADRGRGRRGGGGPAGQGEPGNPLRRAQEGQDRPDQ